MKTAMRWTLLSAALLWLTGARAAEIFSFGVLPQRSALLTAQYWNPILDYVQGKTGVHLVLKVVRSAQESSAAIDRGQYDFVCSNAIFRQTTAETEYRVILTLQNQTITSQIVTLADSSVKNLRELQGRKVGFSSPVSFTGYAVPLDHLMRLGLSVDSVFGGNEEGILAQLKAGRVVAAGINSQVLLAFAAREHLRYRVLWESPAFLNLPLAAHPRVPTNAVRAVQVALDDMVHNPAGFKILQASAQVIGQAPPYGFRRAHSADYLGYHQVIHQNTPLESTR